MSQILEGLNYGWALVVAFVSAVGWFVRLESRVSALEKELKAESTARQKAVDDLKNESAKQILTMWTKIDLMNGSIVQILQATARLETALMFKQKE